MKQSFKRRKYFIDKGSQSRFVAGFASSCVAGGVLAVVCFWYLSNKKIEATLYSMRLPEVPMGSLLMDEMLLALAVSLVFVLVLFVFTAKKVFVRIDGPLKKMAAAVRTIAGGDLKTAVRLRENDEFQAFAGEMDAMVCQMNKKFKAVQDISGQIVALSQQGKTAGTAREQMNSLLRSLREELQVFRV